MCQAQQGAGETVVSSTLPALKKYKWGSSTQLFKDFWPLFPREVFGAVSLL